MVVFVLPERVLFLAIDTFAVPFLFDCCCWIALKGFAFLITFECKTTLGTSGCHTTHQKPLSWVKNEGDKKAQRQNESHHELRMKNPGKRTSEQKGTCHWLGRCPQWQKSPCPPWPHLFTLTPPQASRLMFPPEYVHPLCWWGGGCKYTKVNPLCWGNIANCIFGQMVHQKCTEWRNMCKICQLKQTSMILGGGGHRSSSTPDSFVYFEFVGKHVGLFWRNGQLVWPQDPWQGKKRSENQIHDTPGQNPVLSPRRARMKHWTPETMLIHNGAKHICVRGDL